jgi:hypothetical protein
MAAAVVAQAVTQAAEHLIQICGQAVVALEVILEMAAEVPMDHHQNAV